MMTSTTFDETNFISQLVRLCQDDLYLNSMTVFTEKYISEIGFDSDKEKAILQSLRVSSDSYASIQYESLFSYLLNKFEYELDMCDDSDADTDSDDA